MKIPYERRLRLSGNDCRTGTYFFNSAPKHGSWLDIAEIELNVMTRQCLRRRIEDIDTLRIELAAWDIKRNSKKATVKWQFTTTDARIKLTSLYQDIG